ncbi:MAG: glycosyltransferase family 4 protein [Oscillospiraceae bacterium]|nr:glycosyltransferase family 4 protein [Oscillospiraceae bacterium]
MRILSVTAQRPDSTGSGVYLTELVRGFARLGQTQAVLCGLGPEDGAAFPEGVGCFPVRYETDELPYPVLGMSDQMPYRSTRYCDMTEEMTAQLRAAFSVQIENALRTFRPDVILCHHLYYVTALVRQLCPETPVYALCHGSDLRQIRKNPWQRETICEEIARLDGIFALHEEQKRTIVELYAVPPERITVIGTGYNREIFHLTDARNARGDGKTRLLFAGKIAEKKGVFSLLRAMSRLDRPERYSLTLAGGYGDEEEYARIREAAKAVPCELRFPGKLSQPELAAVMNGSDVFILPSFYEGLPLVLIEAMACGLRCVCTDLPGIRPWLDAQLPGHGVVFVPPPQMVNQDEALPESLPAFEQALAAAIESAGAAPLPDRERLHALSWDGLCERLLPLLKA